MQGVATRKRDEKTRCNQILTTNQTNYQLKTIAHLLFPQNRSRTLQSNQIISLHSHQIISLSKSLRLRHLPKTVDSNRQSLLTKQIISLKRPNPPSKLLPNLKHHNPQTVNLEIQLSTKTTRIRLDISWIVTLTPI